MLDIDCISKRFGNLTAVDELSVSVAAGEVRAFLGPNGAGKTTTIKICTGLLQPDSGTVTIAGVDAVTDGVEARRQIAYVPDEPYLYERLTGREFLDFTARVYGLDRATFKDRLEEVTERFALNDFLDQLAEGYSHGMRQRVVLAAAMLHRPRLLIVDEPLVGLDPKHIRVVLSLLRDMANEGHSVLMSTHTLAAVEDIADSVTVINHGKALYDGPVADFRGEQGLESQFLAMTDQPAEEDAAQAKEAKQAAS